MAACAPYLEHMVRFQSGPLSFEVSQHHEFGDVHISEYGAVMEKCSVTTSLVFRSPGGRWNPPAISPAGTMSFDPEVSSSVRIYEVDISIIVVAYDVSVGEVVGHEIL